MKYILPLALLLTAGCLRQGSSYSPKKMENNRLFTGDTEGRVGQEFRGHLFYYFEAADHSLGQRRGKVTVVDALPAGLKQEFAPHSMDTWIKGKPTQAGTWKLKVEIVDEPSGRKVNDSFTITVK